MRPTARPGAALVAALAGLSVGVAACTTEPTGPPPAPLAGTASSAERTTTPPAPRPTIADPALDAQLWQAAATDNAIQVRDLIARGADLETRGEHGRTPLVAAAKNRATTAARALIDAGADVNATDDLADSAYLYAGAEGLDEILEMTLTHGADLRSLNRYGGTALIPASEHGHVETVRRLIEAGVEVNHINDSGWTAMHEAIVYGDGSSRYQEVVAALLSAGADPSIHDGAGRTAPENARRLGQSAIVAMLDAHRASGTADGPRR
ncbi:ankyrin repeat domain-containing protein [Nocardia carnea]|uniref:ankyrin repeat domain-containing protein n=1 Tax=Nocardia carnea TaxID=37328 RepID=UPI002458439A|nr:ankyrin repeat domain-containing protein [Nocardia carnea]